MATWNEHIEKRLHGWHWRSIDSNEISLLKHKQYDITAISEEEIPANKFDNCRRDIKTIKSIYDNDSLQFVNADCGLVLALNNNPDLFVQGSIDWKIKKTAVFEPSCDSNICVISPPDRAAFLATQIEQMKKIFIPKLLLKE